MTTTETKTTDRQTERERERERERAGSYKLASRRTKKIWKAFHQ